MKAKAGVRWSGRQTPETPLETLGYIVGASQGPQVPPVLRVIILVTSYWLIRMTFLLSPIFSPNPLFLLPNTVLPYSLTPLLIFLE